MRSKTMFVLVIIGVLALCLSLSQPTIAASDEEEVLEVMTNFHKAFNTGDLKLMSSLHLQSSKTTKFAPDITGAFLVQGWDVIGEGWKEILTENIAGTYNNSLHQPQVTMLGDDVAVITGYFVGTYTHPETKEQFIGLNRQTLVVQKISGKWLIVHEHTSGFPTE